jgi:hypothetical protein
MFLCHMAKGLFQFCGSKGFQHKKKTVAANAILKNQAFETSNLRCQRGFDACAMPGPISPFAVTEGNELAGNA